MTQRYFLYDTQIVDPTKDPLKSRELLNLEDLNVLNKIPTKKGIALFYLHEDGYVVYGDFELKENENYEGEIAPLSEYVTFSEETKFFVKNSFYDPDGSYYFFYEINDNIYLRTFYLRQGIFGEEILVKEKARVLKMERIKENFFFVIKDLEHKLIFDKVDELDDGEVKLLFLFENDITRFEGKYDQILKTQTIETPFTDIGIERWSCENKVSNNKGFLYFTDDVTLKEEAKSINGLGFVTNGDGYMEMNKDAEDYTLTVRGKWVSQDVDLKLETDNIIVEYVDASDVKVTYPDGSIEQKPFVNKSYVNTTITCGLVDGKRIYQLYFTSNEGTEEVTFQKAIDVETLVGYQNDSYLRLSQYRILDYISLQNFAQTLNAVKDVHRALERNLVQETHSRELLMTGDNIDNYIYNNTKEVRRTTLLPIPGDATLIEDDYDTDKYGDYEKTFWLCPNITLEIKGTEKITVFMESNSTLINDGASKARIYAKSGSIINVNDASNFDIIYEDGVIITSPGDSTYTKKEEQIVFDYDLLSVDGCREEELNPSVKITQFPILPSDMRISYIKATCLQEPDAANRFFDNEDGTITDSIQNIMWFQTPQTIGQNKSNKQNQAYGQARSAADFDYTDWRLPTITELQSLSGVIEMGTTCISATSATSGMSGTCLEYINSVDDDGLFDFSGYVDPFSNNVTSWTTSSTGDSKTGSGDFYVYDFQTHTSSLVSATSAPHDMGLFVRDTDARLKVLYDDGTQLELPTIEGEEVELEKEGSVTIYRPSIGSRYSGYRVFIEYDEVIKESKNIVYPKHFKLNSSKKFFFGKYLPVLRDSNNNDLRDTVLPIFIEENTNIPNAIFTNPEDNIRICENIRQRYDLTPFIIEYGNDVLGVTVWTPFTRFRDQVGIQYSLKDEFLLEPTYSRYETLASNTYPIESYYCAYHFDQLANARQMLVKDVTLEVSGEIFMGGITDFGTYLREIKQINFFGSPSKYKTAEFNVLVDPKDIADRESYINNYEEVRNFIRTIVENWKPSTTNINKLIEEKTLVMAELIKDEYTQVLVGVTARQNSNAYYVRSVDTGSLSVVSSSTRFGDEVDWIGVGRINTPYVKTGVTKIRKSAKRVKIPFETRYDSDAYRTFVFSPNDTKYYVTSQDREGFIVESSSLVEDEVAWITLNTKQAINGVIDWKRAVPEGELLENNLDRIDEVNEHSNRYVVKFEEFGFPRFENDDYSVILSSDKNVNLWVESKNPKSFIIRRSYAGEDTKINFMVVEGNSKWWKNITG